MAENQHHHSSSSSSSTRHWDPYTPAQAVGAPPPHEQSQQAQAQVQAQVQAGTVPPQTASDVGARWEDMVPRTARAARVAARVVGQGWGGDADPGWWAGGSVPSLVIPPDEPWSQDIPGTREHEPAPSSADTTTHPGSLLHISPPLPQRHHIDHHLLDYNHASLPIAPSFPILENRVGVGVSEVKVNVDPIACSALLVPAPAPTSAAPDARDIFPTTTTYDPPLSLSSSQYGDTAGNSPHWPWTTAVPPSLSWPPVLSSTSSLAAQVTPVDPSWSTPSIVALPVQHHHLGQPPQDGSFNLGDSDASRFTPRAFTSSTTTDPSNISSQIHGYLPRCTPVQPAEPGPAAIIQGEAAAALSPPPYVPGGGTVPRAVPPAQPAASHRPLEPPSRHTPLHHPPHRPPDTNPALAPAPASFPSLAPPLPPLSAPFIPHAPGTISEYTTTTSPTAASTPTTASRPATARHVDQLRYQLRAREDLLKRQLAALQRLKVQYGISASTGGGGAGLGASLAPGTVAEGGAATRSGAGDVPPVGRKRRRGEVEADAEAESFVDVPRQRGRAGRTGRPQVSRGRPSAPRQVQRVINRDGYNGAHARSVGGGNGDGASKGRDQEVGENLEVEVDTPHDGAGGGAGARGVGVSLRPRQLPLTISSSRPERSALPYPSSTPAQSTASPAPPPTCPRWIPPQYPTAPRAPTPSLPPPPSHPPSHPPPHAFPAVDFAPHPRALGLPHSPRAHAGDGDITQSAWWRDIFGTPPASPLPTPASYSVMHGESGLAVSLEERVGVGGGTGGERGTRDREIERGPKGEEALGGARRDGPAEVVPDREERRVVASSPSEGESDSWYPLRYYRPTVPRSHSFPGTCSANQAGMGAVSPYADANSSAPPDRTRSPTDEELVRLEHLPSPEISRSALFLSLSLSHSLPLPPPPSPPLPPPPGTTLPTVGNTPAVANPATALGPAPPLSPRSAERALGFPTSLAPLMPSASSTAAGAMLPRGILEDVLHWGAIARAAEEGAPWLPVYPDGWYAALRCERAAKGHAKGEGEGEEQAEEEEQGEGENGEEGEDELRTGEGKGK